MADEQQPSGGVPSTWATHPSQRSSSPGGPGEKPGREPVAGAERPGQQFQVIGSLDRYLVGRRSRDDGGELDRHRGRLRIQPVSGVVERVTKSRRFPRRASTSPTRVREPFDPTRLTAGARSKVATCRDRTTEPSRPASPAARSLDRCRGLPSLQRAGSERRERRAPGVQGRAPVQWTGPSDACFAVTNQASAQDRSALSEVVQREHQLGETCARCLVKSDAACWCRVGVSRHGQRVIRDACRAQARTKKQRGGKPPV
jgi:hypothetical protein